MSSLIIFKPNNNIGFSRGIDAYSTNPYLKEIGNKNLTYFKTGGFIDYITRDEACFNYEGEMPTFDSDKEALNWFNSHTKKFNILNNETNINSGLFWYSNDKKQFINVEKSFVKKELGLMEEEQYIWDTHLSFGEFGITKRIFDHRKISKLLVQNLDYFFHRNNLSLNNLNVIFAIHANTKNPHIHLAFWEKQRSLVYPNKSNLSFKKDGFIKISEFKKFAAVIEQKLLDEQKYEIYQNHVKELRDLKIDLRNLFKQDQEIKDLEHLAMRFNELRKPNALNYKTLNKEAKAVINEMIEMNIRTNPELENLFNDFINTKLIILNDSDGSIFMKEHKYEMIKKEESELWNGLGNAMIKKIKEGQLSKTENISLKNKNRNILILKKRMKTKKPFKTPFLSDKNHFNNEIEKIILKQRREALNKFLEFERLYEK
ncbi:relaxase MobL [[Mycoplasma] anseris]|uniref:Uncharacterized protein n=1 Tax=[Mycoplasma] anseris TaxID=92400 RepID=A0A2Z4NCW1_9BACT|nr:relaxase MobL [[Mycoplasma] anseris]AWX69411.1 hypothetical protein DP065_01415 [[Mycoplasma] anseris]